MFTKIDGTCLSKGSQAKLFSYSSDVALSFFDEFTRSVNNVPFEIEELTNSYVVNTTLPASSGYLLIKVDGVCKGLKKVGNPQFHFFFTYKKDRTVLVNVFDLNRVPLESVIAKSIGCFYYIYLNHTECLVEFLDKRILVKRTYGGLEYETSIGISDIDATLPDITLSSVLPDVELVVNPLPDITLSSVLPDVELKEL